MKFDCWLHTSICANAHLAFFIRSIKMKWIESYRRIWNSYYIFDLSPSLIFSLRIDDDTHIHMWNLSCCTPFITELIHSHSTTLLYCCWLFFFFFLSSVSSNQCMLLFHIEFAGQLLINKCKIVLINKIIRAHVHWVLRLYYRAWETHLNRNSLQLATYNTHVRCTQYRWVCISIRLVIS